MKRAPISIALKTVAFLLIIAALTVIGAPMLSRDCYLTLLEVAQTNNLRPAESFTLIIGEHRYPKDYYAQKAIGLSRYERGITEIEHSHEALTKAIDALPNEQTTDTAWNLYVHRAQIRKMKGQTTNAIADLEAALQIVENLEKQDITVFGASSTRLRDQIAAIKSTAPHRNE